MPHLADRWEDRVVSFQLCPGALVLSAARRRQRAGYNRFTGCKMHDAVTGCKMHHAGTWMQQIQSISLSSCGYARCAGLCWPPGGIMGACE